MVSIDTIVCTIGSQTPMFTRTKRKDIRALLKTLAAGGIDSTFRDRVAHLAASVGKAVLKSSVVAALLVAKGMDVTSISRMKAQDDCPLCDEPIECESHKAVHACSRCGRLLCRTCIVKWREECDARSASYRCPFCNFS